MLITGVAGFLGSRLARHFHRLGYSVIGLDIKEYVCLDDEQKEYLSSYYAIDLSNTENVVEVCRRLIRDYDYIPIIVNNASNRLFAAIGSFSDKQISDSVNINLKSPLLLCNLLLPSIQDHNYGRIINISSVSAINGYSTGSVYCSTKMGLITFTESLSKELRDTGISVNTICPDSFATKEGKILGNGQKIIDKIISKTEFIIKNNINGRCFFISDISRRLQYSLVYLLKSFNFLRG